MEYLYRIGQWTGLIDIPSDYEIDLSDPTQGGIVLMSAFAAVGAGALAGAYLRGGSKSLTEENIELLEKISKTRSDLAKTSDPTRTARLQSELSNARNELNNRYNELVNEVIVIRNGDELDRASTATGYQVKMAEEQLAKSIKAGDSEVQRLRKLANDNLPEAKKLADNLRAQLEEANRQLTDAAYNRELVESIKKSFFNEGFAVSR